MISKERAKERISWIDTAKGFLMLCVIAGHTLRLGSIPQRMIYSFHIPLFVILSGFTMGEVKDWNVFWQKLKKLFFKLYVPMLIIYILDVFGLSIKNGWNFGQAFSYLSYIFLVSNGVPWFLCALFWAKIIYNLILLTKREPPILFLLIFIAGFFTVKLADGKSYQNFDMVPFYIFFLFIGRSARKKHFMEFMEKHGTFLLYFAFPFWFLILNYSYFDLGLRNLGNIKFAISSVVVSCIIMIYFCKLLDFYLGMGQRASLLTIIGRHTLLLLAVHELEFKLIPWHTHFLSRFDEYGTLLLRIIFNLVVWGVIMCIRFLYIKHKEIDKDLGFDNDIN